MAKTVYLNGNDLTIGHLSSIARGQSRIALSKEASKELRNNLRQFKKKSSAPYGINMESRYFQFEDLYSLTHEQKVKKFLYSHAVSCGGIVDLRSVRAALACKLNSIISQKSPVAINTLNTLVKILNRGVTPLVRENDSVDAGGLSSALSEIILVAIGDGEAVYRGESLPGALALKKALITPAEPSLNELPFLVSGFSLTVGEIALLVDDIEAALKNLIVSIAMGIEPFLESEEKEEASKRRKKSLKGFARALTMINKLTLKSGESGHEHAFNRDIIPILRELETNLASTAVLKSEIESIINGKETSKLKGPQLEKHPPVRVRNEIRRSMSRTAAGIVKSIVQSSITHSMILLEHVNSGRLPDEIRSYYTEPFLEQLLGTLTSIQSKGELLSYGVDSPARDKRETRRTSGRESVRVLSELIRLTNSALAIEYLLGYLNLRRLKRKRLGRGTSTAYRKIKSLVDSFDYKKPISHEIAKLESLVTDRSVVLSVEKATGSLDFD